MSFNKKQILTVTAIIFAALLFNRALQNPAAFGSLFGTLGGILAPFIIGGAIAFIINVPMSAIERRLFTRSRRLDKLRRPLAWLITVILLLAFISLVIGIVIPRLAVTLQAISVEAMQIFRNAGQILPEQLGTAIPDLEQLLKDLGFNISNLSGKLADALQNIGNIFLSGFNLVNSIINTLFTLFVGFFFSIYLLFGKERLARQGKKTLYALLPPQRADAIVAVLRLTSQTFKNFITGQCMEACILALLFLAAMLLLRLPYALLISTVIGVTALIPILGAFIGCIFGMLLIGLNSPIRALIFLALFLALQQAEGNLIYPRVVGSKVGLPAIWVLVAITLGGSLFGVIGMLMFIPLCSVAYALFASFVKKRLAANGTPPEKWQS